MRTSNVLLQQHIGRMFQRHWKVQGKRIVKDTGALKCLKEMGYTVTNAIDEIKEQRKITSFPVSGSQPQEQASDSLHQNNCENECLMFRDHNVLLEGLEQAKVLTNTIQLEEGTLPSKIQQFCSTEAWPMLDKLVRRVMNSSLLFDAEQKKLPKRHDPEREAWNFPRDYGITDKRKNFLLCNKLVQLCSSISPDLCSDRRAFTDGVFGVPLKRNDLDLLLSLRADLLVTSPKPLKQIEDPEVTIGVELPCLEPLLPVVSLEKGQMFKLDNIFPILGGSRSPFIQTAFIHYNGTEVSNLYETEVTESQFLGRSLMKSYAFAVAQARYLFGNDVVTPPSPVVIQSIHTDSKQFHFSVLQLNTLQEAGEVHNIYWSLPITHLYEKCDYVDGRPELEGYNPDVIKLILGFYRNTSV